MPEPADVGMAGGAATLAARASSRHSGGPSGRLQGANVVVGVGDVDLHDQIGRMPVREGVCLLVPQCLGADVRFGFLADVEGAIGLRACAFRPCPVPPSGTA